MRLLALLNMPSSRRISFSDTSSFLFDHPRHVGNRSCSGRESATASSCRTPRLLTEEEFHEISPDGSVLDIAEGDHGSKDLAQTEILGHVCERVHWVGGFRCELACNLC